MVTDRPRREDHHDLTGHVWARAAFLAPTRGLSSARDDEAMASCPAVAFGGPALQPLGCSAGKTAPCESSDDTLMDSGLPSGSFSAHPWRLSPSATWTPARDHACSPRREQGGRSSMHAFEVMGASA